jgi:hypothetical protein
VRQANPNCHEKFPEYGIVEKCHECCGKAVSEFTEISRIQRVGDRRAFPSARAAAVARHRLPAGAAKIGIMECAERFTRDAGPRGNKNL